MVAVVGRLKRRRRKEQNGELVVLRSCKLVQGNNCSKVKSVMRWFRHFQPRILTPNRMSWLGNRSNSE